MTLFIFQACNVYHSILGQNKSITTYFCESLENVSKYSYHTEFSSNIIYLSKDSFYYESQGEGRGLWFSHGLYDVKDSMLILKHDEEQTQRLISVYENDKSNNSQYTQYLTLDYLENLKNGELVKKELPDFFILDNYKWKIRPRNYLERELSNSDNVEVFEAKNVN